MSAPGPTWATEAAVAKARRLWDEGWSARLIAVRVRDATKSAIIGYAHRNGWPPRPSPIVRNGTRAEAVPRVETLKAACRPEPLAVPTPGFRTCQYPFGEKPDWRWCGKPVEPGSPYCAQHVRVCYYMRPLHWDVAA